jgi:hypothetical protein
MARHCECFGRIVIKSRARHARPGRIYRQDHHLYGRCWHSLVDSRRFQGAVPAPRAGLKASISTFGEKHYWAAHSPERFRLWHST